LSSTLLEEFAYLAIVLDAFSRRVIGWALETHLQASLAIAALNMLSTLDTPRIAVSCITPTAAFNMPVATTPTCSERTVSWPA